MPDHDGFNWPFIDLVSVSRSVVSDVDSVIVLAASDSDFPALHGGWLTDVDRARAADTAPSMAERVRFRPPTSNYQFRITAPRARGHAGCNGPTVYGVRLPVPGEAGSRAIEIGLFWAGMQLIADIRDRIGEQHVHTIERVFRRACGAGFYARSAGVEEPVIGESLADAAELARLLLKARDSRAAMTIHVGGSRDDEHARAVGFLASGLPSAVTIEMREQ